MLQVGYIPNDKDEIDRYVYFSNGQFWISDANGSGKIHLATQEDMEILRKAYFYEDTDESLKEDVRRALAYSLNSYLFQLCQEGFFDKVKEIENALDKNEVPRARYLLAQLAIERYKIITLEDTREMFYYCNGYYKPHAETLVIKMVDQIFKAQQTSYHRNEILQLVQSKTLTPRSRAFDPYLIALKNCILDLRDFRIYPFSPDMRTNIHIPVEYNPDAKCDVVDTFLDQVLPEGAKDLFYEFLGYCLYPEYFEHKALIMVGDGANGKSTTIELIKSFLGVHNCASVSLQELVDNRFALARLYGKLANLYADLPSRSLSTTGFFKMLTGNDLLEAEIKFKQRTIKFTNRAKLIFSCNQLPYAKDDTFAFYRRWIILHFPNRFVGDRADPHIIKKLTTPEQLSGLLNKALEGLKRLLDRGHFSYKYTVEQVRELYIKHSDPIRIFWENFVEEGDSESYILKDELYQAYKKFCDAFSYPRKASNVFFRRLNEEFGLKAYTGRKRIDGEIKGVIFEHVLKDVDTVVKKLKQETTGGDTLGTTKTKEDSYADKREKIRRLLQEIKCVVKSDPDEVCRLEDLHELAELDTSLIYNYSKEEIKELVEILKDEGYIYEPLHGLFKLTEKVDEVE